MTDSSVSPFIVGRAPELVRLHDIFAASRRNTPRGVVVTGEAGIGKTRLLREFADQLRPDAAVAVGQCVDLGALGTPFEPVRDALRDLVQDFGADSFRDAVGDEHLATLTTLLPELGDGATDAPARDRMHEAVRGALVGLSRVTPILVVLEDLHWADAATLDLLRGVVGRIREGRIMLALSCRTDGLSRATPLRTFLVELERMRHVFRLELSRLDRAEVAAQVAHIRGRDDAVDIDELLRRSDGVPFLVEELLALEGRALPESLRDVVLARYDSVSEGAQAMLRMAAVGGLSVTHRLLEAVYDRSSAELDSALREAIAANILTTQSASYSFRHALTQEAVEGQVLPGERARFHARYAEVLEAAGEPGTAAQIAHHWAAVGDVRRAFTALVQATRDAKATAALASAARFGEQVLDLWPEVEDAATLVGSDRVDFVLEVAASYMETADPRSLALLQRELGRCDPDDHRSRALLLHEQTIFAQGLGLPGICDLAEAAYAELRPDTDDLDRLARVRVTCGLGIVQAFYGDAEVGWSRLHEALDGARSLLDRGPPEPIASKARAELVRVLTSIASIRGAAGDVDAALDGLAEAMAMDDDPVNVLRAAGLRLELLRLVGRHREALEEGRAALGLARDTWKQRSWGSAISLHVMNIHIDLGNLAEAERVGQALIALGPWAFVSGYCRLAQADILRLRDQAVAADELLARHAEAIDGARRSSTGALTAARTVGAVALALGDLPRAWTQVEQVWAAPRNVASRAALRLLVLGAEVLAALRRDHAEVLLAGEPAPYPDAEATLREALDRLSIWEVAGDWRAMVDARLSGPAGTGTDLAAWRAAVEAAARGRVPAQYHSDALYRLGEAELLAGERGEAAVTLGAAADWAERIEDLFTLRRVRDVLARAHMLDAPARTTAAGLVPHLTDRERQVLRLVAEGLTNRQIGRRLFISEKTASVHVSAILRKLGVASRTEAAVLAAQVPDE